VITRRLLLLDTQRLAAYAWRRGKLQPEGVFENRADELARFTDYLRAHAGSHFWMLVNVGEEGYELETIPFLQGGDRRALITRKLGQHFLGTPLNTAISLGYEKTKRKNEKLLLSALTNPAYIDPWLKCLKEAGTALAGIYSLAQLGSRLLRKLGKTDKRSLLLTCQDHSIRESYLVDGNALFSRMAPLADRSIAGIASRMASEAVKLHQYLVGRRMVARSESLPVYVLAHPLAAAAIRQACNDTPSLRFEILDSHHVAQRLGLATPPDDSRAEPIFLHLLATSAPRQQFAKPVHRHDYRISQIRYGLLGLGAVALYCSVLFAIKQLYDTYDLRRETQTLVITEQELDWRYREIAATFPQIGIDNETLRRVTNRQSELLRQQRTPERALRLLSGALNDAPNIQLDAIDWALGDEPGQPAGTVAPAKGGPRLDSRAETVTLRGTVRRGPASTPRQTLETFEHFVEVLRVDRDSDVSVLQQPIDIESGRALRGGDVDDDSSRPRNYAVQIVRKLMP
jgi:hypothetical protein